MVGAAAAVHRLEIFYDLPGFGPADICDAWDAALVEAAGCPAVHSGCDVRAEIRDLAFDFPSAEARAAAIERILETGLARLWRHQE